MGQGPCRTADGGLSERPEACREDAESPRSSRIQPIKSAIGNDAVHSSAGPRSFKEDYKGAGTSSNGTSIPSRINEAWPPATNSLSRPAAEPFSGQSASGWPL